MKRMVEAVLLALVLSSVSLTGTVAQQAASDAFVEACEGNPGFFSFALAKPGEDAESHAALCACLVGEFSAYPAADLEMLTRDVDGTATAEDRTAYGDYTALELKAREALDGCLVAAGLGGERADMAGFDAACQSSELLLGTLGGTPDEAATARTAICQCLSRELSAQVTTADADVLGRDLDGTATEESRAAHPGYAAIAETAGAIFDQCAASIPAPSAP